MRAGSIATSAMLTSDIVPGGAMRFGAEAFRTVSPPCSQPPGSIITLWESGHIVDKGRGLPDRPNAAMRDSIVFEGNGVTDRNARPSSILDVHAILRAWTSADWTTAERRSADGTPTVLSAALVPACPRPPWLVLPVPARPRPHWLVLPVHPPPSTPLARPPCAPPPSTPLARPPCDALVLTTSAGPHGWLSLRVPHPYSRPPLAPAAAALTLEPCTCNCACSAPRLRTAGSMLDIMGSYDPIRHRYTEARDPAYAERKEREFQRATGGRRAGVAMVADPVRASFDPILGQSRLVPVRADVQRPTSAAACHAATPPGERAATPGRRTRVTHGESWGTYNPITHTWSSEPRNAKFIDQNKVTDRTSGISGSQLGKPNTRINQGIYNPVLNTWQVTPANARTIGGNSFAPASIFRTAPDA
eukprot:358035-Chlamydomonas_euryale.AAC.3